MKTPQIDKWTGDFGRQYTECNEDSLQDVDELYQNNYGLTRAQLNAEFLEGMDCDLKILEVGCNIDNYLLRLQDSGFKRLYGIEIQEYALERARTRLQGTELKQASAFEIPYPDRYFDLVGLRLVGFHSPNKTACAPVYFGYSPWQVLRTNMDQHPRREHPGSQDFLWTMDYAKFYQARISDLDLVKERRLPYSGDANIDAMFLLRKQVARW